MTENREDRPQFKGEPGEGPRWLCRGCFDMGEYLRLVPFSSLASPAFNLRVMYSRPWAENRAFLCN